MATIVNNQNTGANSEVGVPTSVGSSSVPTPGTTLPFPINGLAQLFAAVAAGSASPVINGLDSFVVLTNAALIATFTVALPTPTAAQLATFAAGGQLVIRVTTLGGITLTTFTGSLASVPVVTSLTLAGGSISFQWNGSAWQIV